MPVMNKMRDSMPVVFAVLAGIFLLMIIFEWGGQGTLFQSHGDATTLGTVNGIKISQKDYDQILQTQVEQAKTQQKKTDLSDAEMAQAEDQAWDNAVTDALVRGSIDKMGITVTDQDIRDAMFENPPESIRGQFTDSLGVFHADAYIKALRDPRNDSIVRVFEGNVREQLVREKWQQTLMSTVRVTDEELKDRFTNENSKANIQVIKVMPTAADEAQAMKQVSDQDIQKYYDDHSWQYKQEESRKFKFVVFQLSATPKDTADAMEAAKGVRARLAEASTTQLDSVAKSIAPDYSGQPYRSVHLLTPRDFGTDTALANAKPGDVVTAFVAGQLNVVRVISTVDSGAELFHIRHIVLTTGTNNNVDSAKAIAEQIYQRAKTGDFAEIARTRSSDARTASKGGDIGWMPLKQLPPPIADAVSKAAVGEVIPPVVGEGFVDVDQLLGKSNKSLVVVSIPIDIKPSTQAARMQGQQAAIFREQAQKNGFDAAAKTAGYKVIADAPPASRKGPPIFGSHAFINWIFDASKGDISTPFKVGGGANASIVAQLTDISPAGPKPLDDQLKQQIRPIVAKRKAIDGLLARAQQARAAVAADGDMSKAAQALGDTTLKPVQVSMGPAESVIGIPSADYIVNVTAYKQKPGEISQPAKGENGYYIVKTISVQPANDQAFAQQRPALLKQLLQEKQQRFFNTWLSNQKDNATIVDYRSKRD